MQYRSRTVATAFAAAVLLAAGPALAQKQGGTLRMYIWDNPPSASIHEEATVSTMTPFMALFNNLVLYDQHKKLNTTDNIRPELATSWAWNDDKTRLTFKLREGVKWHDGKPFTAKDVACTLDKLQDKGTDKFRKNPRKIWWHNLKEVVANGDHEVSFQLNRPQASFLALFATGYNPVYPCHVSAAEMRTKPVGTGPFKFVEFKSNESGQGGAQPRLLAPGPSLSRRHRLARHLQPVDARAGLRRRRVRHDVLARPDRCPHQGCPVAAAEGDLRAAANKQFVQPDRQPRGRAVQRSEDPHRRWRWRSTARPSSTLSPTARARSAASCWPGPKAFGACRRKSSRHSPATAPMSRRAVRRRARSWRASATVPPTRSRSRWRRATSRSIATRRCSSSTS